ncbi:PREDICTED: cyclin-dependent kinase 2-interacting protein [Propithecus coquereli]|uniref:cyclin-dependent kinase 2-interacting protein n=1 Tax=Propithecus coquereli TaxID=379532 RepID=UPI00063EE04B|nr:PREDICTED: cyclin-dependent kinase 2-interacting protein [Propithecus coquereli]
MRSLCRMLSREGKTKTLGIATPRKPVLSVSARKIKDNAADWHNLILKWETLNDAGFTTANNIANLKISLLTKIQVKMEKLSSTTKGICELENYHHGEESKRPPLFHTWPTTHFYEVSCKLADMYRKELLLKRTVAEELAHCSDHDLTLSYLSMWLHQPYVESDSTLHLESMLLETGHRAL